MTTIDASPLRGAERPSPRRQEVATRIKEYILRNRLKPGTSCPPRPSCARPSAPAAPASARP
ncbi:hypothetical protein V2I01_42330 [Micromonospora sp. BRA006-A]|nr:hypothetical protein [Micromonospora sp. BRA006-A]